MIIDQWNEIEKAVIGVGEYKFCDEFNHLQLSLTKWLSMTKFQREKYLQKIAKLKLQEAKASSLSNPYNSSGLKVSNSNNIFNICGKQFNTQNCMLSSDILQNMFMKAEKLVLGTNSICPSPGSLNAKLVESKSGSCPHFVTVKAKHKYACDCDCAMFKCAKICSHTIACAYIDDQLQPFLSQAITSPSKKLKLLPKTTRGRSPLCLAVQWLEISFQYNYYIKEKLPEACHTFSFQKIGMLCQPLIIGKMKILPSYTLRKYFFLIYGEKEKK